jgi:hypothetical protein
MMTTAQLTTLKAYIDSVPEWAALPNDSDTAYFIAVELNKPAAPDWVVWRDDVRADEIGNAWIGTDIDGLSALNMQRLQLLLASSAGGSFDMRRIDRRAGFENPFGTNQNNASRVAMRAAWKRSATVLEKLFSTGTGTNASPAIMGYVGQIAWPDVQTARGL